MLFTRLPNSRAKAIAPPAPPDGKPWAQHPNEGLDGNADVILHHIPQQTRPKQGLMKDNTMGISRGQMQMHKRPVV